MRFRDKVVIVTGGSKGIGAGCARVFCAEGARVAVFDIDAVAGERTVQELNAGGPGQAALLRCDVSDPEQLRSSIEAVVGQFGRLDCLINNAGVHPPATTIDDTSIEDL